MGEVRIVPTDRLDQIELDDIRALMDDAFQGRFDDNDFEHGLGGYHVMSYVDAQVIVHAAVVARTLHIGSRQVKAGYVENVMVQPQFQGRGLGHAAMVLIGDLIAKHYELGALSAGERAQRVYRKLGWRVWLGPTFVDAPGGRERTADEDGGVMVLGPPDLDLTEPITCDWRSGDVW